LFAIYALLRRTIINNTPDFQAYKNTTQTQCKQPLWIYLTIIGHKKTLSGDKVLYSELKH